MVKWRMSGGWQFRRYGFKMLIIPYESSHPTRRALLLVLSPAASADTAPARSGQTSSSSSATTGPGRTPAHSAIRWRARRCSIAWRGRAYSSDHTFCPVPSCSPTRSCIVTGAPPSARGCGEPVERIPRNASRLHGGVARGGLRGGFQRQGMVAGAISNTGGRRIRSESSSNFAESMAEAIRRSRSFLERKRRIPRSTSGVGTGGLARGSIALGAKCRRSCRTIPSSAQTCSRITPGSGGRCRRGELRRGVGKAEAARRNARRVHERQWLADAAGLANCYDSGTRVPLGHPLGIKLQAGRRVDEFISLTDFAPTFSKPQG